MVADTSLRSAVAPVALPQGREVELRRGTTFVRDLPGPVGAPTLFLLHGWLASADLNWYSSYHALGRHFRVVAIDHRGHGRGVRTRSSFRLEDCADDVAEVARLLGLDPFVAVGYSMGGPIAQLTWRRHPELVDGLVLCATSRNFRGRPADRLAFSVLTGAALAARATPPALRRRLHHRVAQQRHDDSEVGRWARDEFGMGDTRLMIEAGRALGLFDSSPWIGEVDVPTGVVVTENDQLVAPHRQYKLAASIPDARVHPLQADHLVCAAPDAGVRFAPALVDACLDVVARRSPRQDPVSPGVDGRY